MLDLFHTVYRSAAVAAADDDARPDGSPPPLRWRIRGRVVSGEGWIRVVVMQELDRSGKAAVIEEALVGASDRSLHFYTYSATDS